MKSPARIALFVVIVATLILTACGASAAATKAPAVNQIMPVPTAAAFDSESQAMEAPAAPENKAGSAEVPAESVIETGNNTLPIDVPVSNRKIIKNGDIKLLVKDTDTAIDRTTQIIGDSGGYIISSRVWYQDYYGTNYKYATITIGVPVDQFENILRRLRALSVRVLDENASGEDVTNKYVDLQSQLTNLEATRDRIRTFLEQAKTVEEALQVNQQLADVEAQIEQVKGQMNYLTNRSAFSTITINLEPDLPEITPTPTPSPIPTATPTPWDPSHTFSHAQRTITITYQALFELAIWIFIVVVPLLAPPVLIIWGIWKLATRKSKKPASGG